MKLPPVSAIPFETPKLPVTSKVLEGEVLATPTLPFVRMVKPLEALEELDWKRASTPLVLVPLLVTFSKPVVVLTELLVVDNFRMLPEVSELAVMVSASPVVVLAARDRALPVPE